MGDRTSSLQESPSGLLGMGRTPIGSSLGRRSAGWAAAEHERGNMSYQSCVMVNRS